MSATAVQLVEVSRVRSLTKAGRAREIRRNACVSASEVAGALGVSASTVLRWEEGESEPRGEVARRYGDLLEALKGAEVA